MSTFSCSLERDLSLETRYIYIYIFNARSIYDIELFEKINLLFIIREGLLGREKRRKQSIHANDTIRYDTITNKTTNFEIFVLIRNDRPDRRRRSDRI